MRMKYIYIYNVILCYIICVYTCIYIYLHNYTYNSLSLSIYIYNMCIYIICIYIYIYMCRFSEIEFATGALPIKMEPGFQFQATLVLSSLRYIIAEYSLV